MEETKALMMPGQLLPEPLERGFTGKSPFGYEGATAQVSRAHRLSSVMTELFGAAPQTAELGAPVNPAFVDAQDRIRSTNAANRSGGAHTMERAGVDAVEDAASRVRGLVKSTWGKKALIGGGILAGIGALDAVFGGESDPMAAPMMANGSPLPAPTMAGQYADQGMQVPRPMSFRNIHSSAARIERPMQTRQMYNISGSARTDYNFDSMMGSYPGMGGQMPSSNSYVMEQRGGRSETEMTYQIRERLRSSF